MKGGHILEDVKKNNLSDILDDLDYKLNMDQKVLKIDSFVPVHPNVNWSKWGGLSRRNVKNTISYLYDKLHLEVLIYIVKDGKLSRIIRSKDTSEPKQYLRYMKELNPNVKWYETIKAPLKSDLRIMGCILKVWSDDVDEMGYGKPPGYIPDYYGRFIAVINKKYELPDGMYIFAKKDVDILRRDGNEPLVDVVGGLKPLMSHKFKEYYPILQGHTHKDYVDIPMPSFDDWMLVRSEIPESEIEYDWSVKVNRCVFRGATTGCGYTPETNMRMKAALLSRIYPNILDAGISTFTGKLKIHRVDRIGYVDKKKYKSLGSDPIPFWKQSKFKYILHIDGNVAAYRLGATLLLGSCILIQESGAQVWFQHMLKPYTHYVPVAGDLSDLIEKINWCIANDAECEKIARNSLELGKRIMTYDSCVDYMAATLWAINGKLRSRERSVSRGRTLKRSGDSVRRSKTRSLR